MKTNNGPNKFEESGWTEGAVEEWLLHFVDMYVDSEAFRHVSANPSECTDKFMSQCREAAKVALQLRRYRSYAETIGFMPVSFKKYLTQLESMTETSVNHLLEHFRITSLERPDKVSLAGLAKLWHALGFSLPEAVAALKVTLLFPGSPEGFGFARLRRSSGALSPLETCETRIEEAMTELGTAQLEEVLTLERQLTECYKEL